MNSGRRQIDAEVDATWRSVDHWVTERRLSDDRLGNQGACGGDVGDGTAVGFGVAVGFGAAVSGARGVGVTELAELEITTVIVTVVPSRSTVPAPGVLPSTVSESTVPAGWSSLWPESVRTTKPASCSAAIAAPDDRPSTGGTWFEPDATTTLTEPPFFR